MYSLKSREYNKGRQQKEISNVAVLKKATPISVCFPNWGEFIKKKKKKRTE